MNRRPPEVADIIARSNQVVEPPRQPAPHDAQREQTTQTRTHLVALRARLAEQTQTVTDPQRLSELIAQLHTLTETINGI